MKANTSKSKSCKKLRREPEAKKTGSSIGTSKKADLEASKSKSSKAGKNLKKSASLEEIKNKDNLSASKKSLVMDQNGTNLSNNNANSSTAANNGNAGSPASSENSSTVVNPGTSNLLSNYSVNAQLDTESDDSDMSRLQTILESRGLHPHFLGIPRMQNFFYRSLNSTSNSKAQQLLQALNSTTNESEKLHYVLEMCQLLLMGNEDTLVGFPIKTVVPTLINLLSMEHNFEIMHHACRALTYMMEALPRSSVVVLDAVPVFLEKLQVIQCMDVAEQSLSALEMLSRRHNKSILQARGVSACLTYLDFFSIDAQRSALTITANCFQNVTTDDFQFVQDSLPILSSHLSIEDKKCIESICLAFSRLVDCYQQDCAIISEIASSELLTNIQNVLMTVPPILSTGSFVNVIRMLSIMCTSCSQISVELLKLNICETLKCLLLCNNTVAENSDAINLISRSPQEIYELTAFIAELMPSLPLDGIFAVDLLFSKANQVSTEVAMWQWKDDRGLWHPFNAVDNKIIESAHIAGEDELELASLNRTYIIDFNSMQKIYEDTGNSYAIQRKINTFNNSELISRSNMQNVDPRSEFIYKEQELSSSFLKFIFSVLNEVYNNSAGFSVRYKCLNAILRIIYYTPKELLYPILKDQTMSSSIATMLASSDFRIVVCATQMCNILMEKMPEIFSIFFQREGVIHQIRKLYSEESRFFLAQKSSESVSDSKNPSTIVLSNSHSLILDNAQLFINRHAAGESFSQIEYIAQNSISSAAAVVAATAATTTAPVAHITKSSTTRQNSAPEQAPGSDEISKRKRTRKSFAISSSSRANSLNIGLDHSANPTTESGSDNHSAATNPAADVNLCNSLAQSYVNFPLFVSEQVNNSNLTITSSSSNTNSGSKTSTRLSSKEFLQRLNPTRWTRWTQNSVVQNTTTTTTTTTASVPTTSTITTKDLSSLHKSSNANKEKIKSWIKDQAKIFDDKYFLKVREEEKEENNSPSILNDLTESIHALGEDKAQALLSIKKILLETDLSSFELIHSGLVKNLLTFLVGGDCSEETREQNLRIFLNIFYGVPLSDVIESIDDLKLDSKPLSILINKLNACVSQLEQFPLRVHDYASNSSRSSHGIKLLNSNLIKVSLNRHPSCNNLKKYKGPLIKLDPYTAVQSIERYLLTRGYGKIKDVDDEQSDDDVSDEDLIDNITSISSSSQAQGRHRLQLLIGDQVLPYNLPISQGIRQFMANDHQEADSDDAQQNSKFWAATFYIYYRLATDSNAVTSSTSAASSKISSRKGKSTKQAPKKKDEIWLEGKVAKAISPLESYLKSSLSFEVPINDQSIEVLCLLRVLYGIIRHWGYLYKVPHSYNPAIPLKEFINYKLTVKANRQLQDPLGIMSGSLPPWLSEIAYACPFMFPFDTRYLLFYVVCFDRERALQRLFENTPEYSSMDARERSIVPRLEKKKRIVSRNDIFKSAETLFSDLGGSKTLLEIQYENEVGTGLGPTLEFYALVSKEFQRADFDMWRGEVLSNCEFKDEKNDADSLSYVFSSNGLFPAPLGRSTKPSVVNKLKQRFKLLGKFMAKALMDSRMIDIPLNMLFYKWLLNEQSTMTIADIHQLDPTFSTSILQMYKILLRKSKMTLNSNDDMLKLHGCSIDDLNLDFTLPGYSSIELRKGGRDLPVTIANLENYINLVSSWLLSEGVVKQMEAFKEGFNAVFSHSKLQLFYPEELQQLFCGASYKSWDMKMLIESCKTDHGFTHDSKAIHNLFEILSSYNAEEQRKFLQFLTGSPRLPIGGFKSLIPPFTIVRKNNTDSDNTNCLPSVMTCVNYLKLPDYPTIEIMREKLDIAINEGQFSFHLS